MTDIVEFLRARYTEQLAALDSWIGKRRKDSFSHIEMVAHTTATELIPGNPLAPFETDALNQRVAEIRSHLLILDVHAPRTVTIDDYEQHQPGVVICSTCSYPHGDSIGADEYQPHPCTTLRLLALPFAGHTDYDQRWKP